MIKSVDYWMDFSILCLYLLSVIRLIPYLTCRLLKSAQSHAPSAFTHLHLYYTRGVGLGTDLLYVNRVESRSDEPNSRLCFRARVCWSTCGGWESSGTTCGTRTISSTHDSGTRWESILILNILVQHKWLCHGQEFHRSG